MADPEKPPVDPQVHFKGSCACGRITYQSTQALDPQNTGACHCVMCRKLSGGPFMAFTSATPSSIILFDQKDKLRYEGLPKDNIGGITYLRLSKIGERAYCASCNTPLAMRYKHRPDSVDLNLSAIDEDSIVGEEAKRSLKLNFHIFESHKVSWIDLENDGVPKDRRHERFSAGFEDKMDEWEARQSQPK